MPTVKELLSLAREFKHYADKMPNDPNARRWYLASMALISQANAMAGETK